MLPKMIDHFRNEKGWTMKEFGQKMGKSESAISKWIKGIRSPMVEDFDKMVGLFNTTPDILMYGASEMEKSTLSDIINTSAQLEEPRQKVVLETAKEQLNKQNYLINNPIDINEVREDTLAYETLTVHGLESAGEGYYQDEEADIEVNIPIDEIPEDYDDLAMVIGDSMRPKLHNSDILFVKFTKQIEIGQIGIFRTSKGNFVKKLQHGYLESLNPHYDDIYFNDEEECEAIGLVVDWYRK